MNFMLFIQLIVARNESFPKTSAIYTLFTQWAPRDWLIPGYCCKPIRLRIHFLQEPDWLLLQANQVADSLPPGAGLGGSCGPISLLQSQSNCSGTNQTASNSIVLFWDQSDCCNLNPIVLGPISLLQFGSYSTQYITQAF